MLPPRGGALPRMLATPWLSLCFASLFLSLLPTAAWPLNLVPLERKKESVSSASTTVPVPLLLMRPMAAGPQLCFVPSRFTDPLPSASVCPGKRWYLSSLLVLYVVPCLAIFFKCSVNIEC